MKYRDWHIWLGMIFSIILLIVLLTTTAGAHSWYDPDCCDERDCTPVINIEHFPGYQMWYTKLFDPIRIGNKEFNGDFFSVRASQDSKYHICATEWIDSGRLVTRIRCVYLPGTS